MELKKLKIKKGAYLRLPRALAMHRDESINYNWLLYN